MKLPSELRGFPLNKSRGQALLVILLIMAVVLTIGLAVTSRTVTDIEISEQTEEAARAFSAAEAGIEEALYTPGEFFEETIEEGVTYKTQKSGLGKESSYLFSQTKEMNTLWLSEYPDYSSPYTASSLTLLWGDVDLATEEPALEAIVYYKTAGGEVRVLRYALDPNSAANDPNNNFCPPGGTGENCQGVDDFSTGSYSIRGKTTKYRAVLDLSEASSGTPLFARLRLLYSTSVASQALGAQTSAGLFPSQGVKIESVGTAGTSTRRVEVTRLHPAPPEIFDFVLYSETSL